MSTFAGITAIGEQNRIDNTPNKLNQAADHETFQAKIDALIAAGTTAEQAVAAILSTLPLPALTEAYAGLYVPTHSLSRWYYTQHRPAQVAAIGDSTIQGDVGNFDYQNGGPGCWVEHLANALARNMGGPTGSLVSPGFRGLWRNKEWSFTGTWAATTVFDAFNVAPFSSGEYSTETAGTTRVATWTKPAHWFGIQGGFDVYWIDKAPIVANDGIGSYRVDGGPWTTMPITPVFDNKLKRFRIRASVTSTIDFRGMNAAGTVVKSIALAGITPYYQAGATVNEFGSVDQSDGVILHNLGFNGNMLANFMATAQNAFFGGDTTAWLNHVVPGSGDLAWSADLVIMMFTNDEINLDPGAWATNLQAFISLVQPFADILLLNSWEQNNRDPSEQAIYRATLKSVASTNRVAVLDLYEAWTAATGTPGWAAANTAGLMFDNLHESALGHQDIAARIHRALMTFS